MSYSYSDPPSCCASASAELKLYQAFIFSIPIFFTFILLLLFYLFYLRRRRVDWSSLRMRAVPHQNDNSTLSESGLKKELREMLPIIVFRETFSISDAQCSVCLGEYQAEDKLQQIPACGHTFHMDCIDHWLATHTTCPLCRLSLVPPPKKSDSDSGHVSGADQVEAPATVSQSGEGRFPVMPSEDLESQSQGEAVGGEEGGRAGEPERWSSCCSCSEKEEEEVEEERHTDGSRRSGEGGEEGGGGEELSVVVVVEAERSN